MNHDARGPAGTAWDMAKSKARPRNGKLATTAAAPGADQKRHKKFGAPPKRSPKEGEKAAITLRMPADLKRRLDAAADHNGRSQSQEAELRLERSFEREDLLTDALSLRYGKEAAGILVLLAEAMHGAGTARMDERAASLAEIGRHYARPWPDDQEALQHGLLAGIAILALLLPVTDQRDVEGQSSSFHAAIYTIWNLGCAVPHDEPRDVHERVQVIRDLLPKDLLAAIRTRCSRPSLKHEYRNLKAAFDLLNAAAPSYAKQQGIDP